METRNKGHEQVPVLRLNRIEFLTHFLEGGNSQRWTAAKGEPFVAGHLDGYLYAALKYNSQLFHKFP